MNSLIANNDVTDDPLKGLLMDKGAAEASQHIHIVQRKMICIQEAMVMLVESQRTSGKAAGCECIDLYYATNKLSDGKRKVSTANPAALLANEMKAASALEWRAKQFFAKQFFLNPTSRLYPFDATHESHQLIYDYVMQTSPSYYKVLAAYETARQTLNCTLKALRKIVLESHKIKSEAELLPRGIFDKKTVRLSSKLLQDVDTSGELMWILQGLYFEM